MANEKKHKTVDVNLSCVEMLDLLCNTRKTERSKMIEDIVALFVEKCKQSKNEIKFMHRSLSIDEFFKTIPKEQKSITFSIDDKLWEDFKQICKGELKENLNYVISKLIFKKCMATFRRKNGKEWTGKLRVTEKIKK